MKEKNDYVNKLAKEESIKNNNKFYYIRSGECCWKKCMSACCRFTCQKLIKPKEVDYEQMSQYQYIQNIQMRKSNGYDCYISPRLCENITFDGKCKLHKNKKQPRICKFFPMHPTVDGMYEMLKHICGYKFKKVKNIKYKKKNNDRNKSN